MLGGECRKTRTCEGSEVFGSEAQERPLGLFALESARHVKFEATRTEIHSRAPRGLLSIGGWRDAASRVVALFAFESSRRADEDSESEQWA